MDLDAWVVFARRYRLESWAAFALDALEPFAVLGAQALHIAGPVLGLGRSTTASLGHVLEDGRARRELRSRLAADPPD
jgi:hypothetical protein